ncbi:MAG: hypothetical protein Q9174_006657, partial [Haloplaca sp. 1 TL-2023]
MTEDDFYRTSTQYRLWSFTPESLASLRATTNAAAADGVKAAFRSLRTGQNDGSINRDDIGSDNDVDCLTIEEEQKIVGYFASETMDLVDFCNYPTNVK